MNLPVMRLFVIVLTSAVLASLYERTPLHEFVETRLAFTFLFDARARLGEAPGLSPKLKILSYDDTTFTKLGAPDLPLDRWVELLKAIDARGPRAVYIDQIFGTTPRADADKKKSLLGELGELHAPIVTAAFVTPANIQFRGKLDLRQPVYSLRNYFASRDALLKYGFPPLGNRLGWSGYGPTPDLAKTFRRAGHVLNSGRGYAESLIRLAPSAVLPHMTLLGAQAPTIDKGRLHVDGRVVPTDDVGRIIVDFSTPETYYKGSRRVSAVLATMEKGEPLAFIEPGDSVLILPSMYTGNTDFAETPVGQLPGGFVIASLLNSRLRGAWITPVSGDSGPVLVGVILGVLAATLASGYVSFLTVLLAVSLCLGGVAAMFTWGGLLTSVSAPLVGLTLAASAVMSERYRLRERLFLVLKTLKSQNEELQQELQQAGEISRAFIPAKAPTWNEVSIGAYHKPLTSASGDWYAFETSPSGRLRHFLMCDISGHGAQAAIIVSTCKAVLSMIVAENPTSLDREDFVAHYARLLNATLCAHGGGRHTATFLGLTIDAERRVSYCLLAGHPRPIFVGKDKRVGHLGKAGSLLGLMRDARHVITAHPFEPGDNVIAYTDGVPFPRALGKVQKIFDTYRHLDPHSGAKYMAVEAHEKYGTAAAHAADDVSLVWFGYREPKETKLPAAG